MWASSRYREFLGDQRLFSNFTPQELDDLGDLVEAQVLAPGDRLFTVGDAPQACFFVFEGQVRTVIDRDSETLELAALGAGDVVGQVALLDGEPHSASAEAVGKATVLRIDRGKFDAQFAEGTAVAYKLLDVLSRVLVRQMRSANELLSSIARAEQAAEAPKPLDHPDVQSVFADIAGKLDAARVSDMDLPELTIAPVERED